MQPCLVVLCNRGHEMRGCLLVCSPSLATGARLCCDSLPSTNLNLNLNLNLNHHHHHKVVSTSCHKSACLDQDSGFLRMVHTVSSCVFKWHPTNHVDDSSLQCLPPSVFLLAGTSTRSDGQKMLDHHVLSGPRSSRSRQEWLTAFPARLFKTDLCTSTSTTKLDQQRYRNDTTKVHVSPRGVRVTMVLWCVPGVLTTM